jgi:hypothetical protein
MVRTKKTATIDPNSVEIAAFCQSQGINEQIFRLELMQHLDNADSAKVVEFSVAQTVANSLASVAKTLPSQPQQQLEPQETQINSESQTETALQPATATATGDQQKPQNSSIATSGNSSQVSAPGQTATGATVPTALTEFIAKAQDDIELFDLVHLYRNEQILTNSESRDSELVLKLREQRLENRAMVFDQLRGLNARQPVPQELPELPGLADEISGLCNELGKSLNRAA